MTYLLALHVVAVVTWFAGLFYLPRLFVYHEQSTDEIGIERFKIMERKLYRGIMIPSAIAVAALGIWLALLNLEAYATQWWFWTKIGLVLCLYEYHRVCGRMVRRFQNDINVRSHRFYRWFNEIPLVFLIAITVLAIAKPF